MAPGRPRIPAPFLWGEHWALQRSEDLGQVQPPDPAQALPQVGSEDTCRYGSHGGLPVGMLYPGNPPRAPQRWFCRQPRVLRETHEFMRVGIGPCEPLSETSSCRTGQTLRSRMPMHFYKHLCTEEGRAGRGTRLWEAFLLSASERVTGRSLCLCYFCHNVQQRERKFKRSGGAEGRGPAGVSPRFRRSRPQ